MFTNRISAMAIAAVALALGGCFLDNSGEGGPRPLGRESITLKYTVSGDRIITPADTAAGYWCDGDQLRRHEDFDSTPDTVRFTVTANTLTLYTQTDTVASGAVLEGRITITRLGGGSGLQGDWKTGTQTSVVISGTLTAEEEADRQKDDAFAAKMQSYGTSYFRIDATTITSYIDFDGARQFVDQWNGLLDWDDFDTPDSAKYDIEVKALDAETVRLTGRISGEVVTIKMNRIGDRDYASSMPEHKPHHHAGKTTACPNNWQPSWYLEFQNANGKPGTDLEKVTAGLKNPHPMGVSRLPWPTSP